MDTVTGADGELRPRGDPLGLLIALGGAAKYPEEGSGWEGWGEGTWRDGLSW